MPRVKTPPNRRTPTVTDKSKRKSQRRPIAHIYRVGNRQYKISTKVLREIKILQESVRNCIPKLPFARLIREILMQYMQPPLKVTSVAFEALQEAAEMYLTQLFEDSNACARHAGRVTLFPRDMQLVLNLRGLDPGKP